MAIKVNVTLLLDIPADQDASAFDWVNETLRPMQACFGSNSGLIDYAIDGGTEAFDYNAVLYEEGDAFGAAPRVETDHDAMLAIQECMDGVAWDSDTAEQIAQIMIDAGYRIRDCNDVDLAREDAESCAEEIANKAERRDK